MLIDFKRNAQERKFYVLWRGQPIKNETVIDSAGFLKTSSTNEEKIAALAEMICRSGDEAGTCGAIASVFQKTLCFS